MRHYPLYIVAGLAFASAGCQKSPAPAVQMVAVQGKVTLDGSPLDGAEVVFTTPLMATFTAQTSADGSYQLATAGKGSYTCSGPCKVTVSKFVMPPGKTAEPNRAPQLQGAQQVLLPRYADAAQTTLVANVPEQGGQFDFPLTSR
ncbi:MAG TPA: hypothetical protein VHC22_07060 [Pirellulales bacterium]|nr:hypothetical protein [Pirellulales bacterium]